MGNYYKNFKQWLYKPISIEVFFWPALTLFILFFLQRILYFRLLFSHFYVGDFDTWIPSLVRGSRFDALVVGYFLFGLVGITGRKAWTLFYTGVWLLAAIFLFSMDRHWLALVWDRWNLLVLQNFQTLVNQLSLSQWMGFLSSFLAQLIFSAFFFWRLKKIKIIERRLGTCQLPRWIIFVIAGLMARGSLGPYHLDLRHSLVTDSYFLNLGSLNSMYAFDQALRGRR